MKWLADENFDNDILRGILRRTPVFDVVRVQDIPEISGLPDSEVLAWATKAGRTLLTHDVSTMIPAMRRQRNRPTPCAPVLGRANDDILLLDECSVATDLAAG